MAEYYPLLAKAVAGLPEPTPEARQALYERARNALLNQLRNLRPPVAEADIERETEALASAAARLEAEYGTKDAALKTSVTAPVPAAAEALRNVVEAAPKTARPFPAVLPRRQTSGEGKAPAPEPAPPPPPKDSTPAPELHGGPQRAAEDNGWAENAQAQKLRPEVARPYAPQPPKPETPQHMRRLWIVGGVVVLVIAVIAVAAWKLRDRPEDVMRPKPTAQSQAEASTKIAERVGDSPSSKPQDAARPANEAANSETARARVDEPAPIPVAQRAALLVEAPDTPEKVKTYVGTVVWRVDNASNDGNQPLGTAVRADIDIPEAKLKIAMTIQKNLDASLSASHTITLLFLPAADSPIGAVKEIRVPQMRAQDAPSGDSLSGIPVPIMANSFLVGLTRGAAENANLELLKQREWVDIPMVLQANGRIAKLTFEKSTTGQRAIEDAMASWQAQ